MSGQLRCHLLVVVYDAVTSAHVFDGGGTPYEVLVITEQLLVGVKSGRLSGSGGMVAEGHTLNTQTTISAFGFGKLTTVDIQ